MKHKTLSLAVLASIILVNAYSQSTFQKLVKGNGRTHLNSVSRTTDGYIHVGQILDDSDIVVTKFDENANIDWMHFFADSVRTHYGLANIVQVGDGGYIIATTNPLLVFKLNRVGNIAWSKKIGFSSASGYILNSKQDMIYSNDGTVIITGLMSEESLPNIIIPYVLKINYNDGAIIWCKRLRLQNTEGFTIESYGIRQISNGSYIICGSFGTPNHIKHPRASPHPNPLLTLLDINGEVQWSRILKASYNHGILYTVAETLDGGYIATGVQFGAGGPNNMPIVKFDHVGNVEWAKNITGALLLLDKKDDLLGNEILVNYDTSYTIVGRSLYGRFAKYTIGFALKLNKTGDSIWARSIGGEKFKPVILRNILKTEDSGFIVSGDYSTKGQKTYLVLAKFDKNGKTCSDSMPVTYSQDLLYTPIVDSAMISQDLTSFVVTSDYSLRRDTGHKYISTICSSELPDLIVQNNAVKNISSTFSLKIFPNPVISNHLNLTIKYSKTNNVQLAILNMEGKTIVSKTLLLIPGISSKSIDVSSLIGGVYILRVTNGQEHRVVKFVKQSL